MPKGERESQDSSQQFEDELSYGDPEISITRLQMIADYSSVDIHRGLEGYQKDVEVLVNNIEEQIGQLVSVLEKLEKKGEGYKDVVTRFTSLVEDLKKIKFDRVKFQE